MWEARYTCKFLARILRFRIATFQHFFALVVIISSVSFIVAQEGANQSVRKGWGVPSSPLNCEMNLQNLEYVRGLIRGQQGQNNVLILIARLGNGEFQHVLNYRRLHNVRVGLNKLLDVPAEKTIVAEGKRVRGFGRVEFYLGGELVGALLVNRQSDICVRCCGPDERFYPYKNRPKRKPYQRKRVSRIGPSLDDITLLSHTRVIMITTSGVIGIRSKLTTRRA